MNFLTSTALKWIRIPFSWNRNLHIYLVTFLEDEPWMKSDISKDRISTVYPMPGKLHFTLSKDRGTKLALL